jgi:hypothetical protein
MRPENNYKHSQYAENGKEYQHIIKFQKNEKIFHPQWDRTKRSL